MFGNVDELPLPSPIVTFTGPILGPGTELLQEDDVISDIDESQRKCCGFVQLSTFITPVTRRRPHSEAFIRSRYSSSSHCMSIRGHSYAKDGCKVRYPIPTKRLVQLHRKSGRVA
jgi:hypothetical protein